MVVGRGERERKGNIHVTEKHRLVVSHMCQLGVESAASVCALTEY